MPIIINTSICRFWQVFFIWLSCWETIKAETKKCVNSSLSCINEFCHLLPNQGVINLINHSIIKTMISVARRGSEDTSAISKPAKHLSSDFNSRTAAVIVSAKGIKVKFSIEIFTFSFHSGTNKLKNTENNQKKWLS